MSWLKLHDSFNGDPKVWDLSIALEVPEAQAAGHVALLWTWCLVNAEDGDLSTRTPRHIARAMKWTGDPGFLVDALLDARLLDDDPLRVHDWMEFQGSWTEAVRKRKEREGRTKSGPTIYLLDDGPAIKVGFTEDLSRRVSEYKGGKARLVSSRPGTRQEEAAAHVMLSKWRIGHHNSEWFAKTPESSAIVQDLFQCPVTPARHRHDTGNKEEKRREEKERGEEEPGRSPTAWPSHLSSVPSTLDELGIPTHKATGGNLRDPKWWEQIYSLYVNDDSVQVMAEVRKWWLWTSTNKPNRKNLKGALTRWLSKAGERNRPNHGVRR